MNVFQKINEVKEVVKGFTKDAETSGKGAYSYTSGAQILAAIKEKMEEVGLLFLPVETHHRGWTTFNYKNAYGDEKTDFIVEGELVYEWVNVDEPSDRQRVLFEYYGQQNDISKAFGSALTYSERYLLLKSLGAPTDEDDPDKKTEEKTERKAPPKSEGKKQTPGTQQKTKWARVNELLKESDLSISDVTDWIVKKYKKSIKINDLSDKQFEELMTALKKAIEGESGE